MQTGFMQKSFKRTVAAVLAVLMALGLVFTSACAGDEPQPAPGGGGGGIAPINRDAAWTMMRYWEDAFNMDLNSPEMRARWTHNFGEGYHFSTWYWSDQSYKRQYPTRSTRDIQRYETGFWQAANTYEMYNTALSFAEPGSNEWYHYVQILTGYRNRFLNHSFSWSGQWYRNDFTDDLLWWSVAFTRTYMLTGDEAFLIPAIEIFEFSYERAWDPRGRCSSCEAVDRWDFCPYDECHLGPFNAGVRPGGWTWQLHAGRYWNGRIRDYHRNSKNSITNGLAGINAGRLALIFRDRGDTAQYQRYLEILRKTYHWMWDNLAINHNTGRITDSHNFGGPGGPANRWDAQFTYNYAVFAATSYYLWLLTDNDRYLQESLLVLRYGWDTLTHPDNLTIRADYCMLGSDGSSFRVVLGRLTGYMYVNAPNGEFNEFGTILRANAYQAWHHRRLCDGMTGGHIAVRLLPGVRVPAPLAAFGVSVMFYSGFDPNVNYGFEENLIRFTQWGEDGIHVAAQAINGGVNFHPQSPGALGGTHTQWWDTAPQGPAHNHNPDGTRRFLEFPVYVETAGMHDLVWRWYTRYNDDSRRWSVNGDYMGIQRFIRTRDHTWEHQRAEAFLRQGVNNIRIWLHHEPGVYTNNWLFIDYLRVTPQ